jgi:hypothetical protein
MPMNKKWKQSITPAEPSKDVPTSNESSSRLRHARLVDSPDGRHQAAVLLHAYMEARARHEGVGYGLNTAFFSDGLANGIHTFFGVTLDEHAPKILRDEQNPQFLGHYQRGDA